MTNFKNAILVICLIMGITAIAIGAFYLFVQQDPITKTVDVTLEIQAAPDFTLAVSPPLIQSPIDRMVSYAASVASVDGFTGDIVFSVTGAPAGVVITYFPSDTLTLGAGQTMGVQIDVMIPDDVALLGTYVLTVSATSDNYN